MTDFCDKKFRPCGDKIVYDEYGNAKEKTVFMPTSAYIKYLKEKRQEAKEQEIKTLRAKLEYQYKTYGEVDQIELNYFLSLVS